MQTMGIGKNIAMIHTMPLNLKGLALPKVAPKPPLKWAGGKRWLLPRLQSIWQPHTHRRLVEPFAGGLAVTLGLMPKAALANDINIHLINFYKQVKNGLEVNVEFENSIDAYYTLRIRFNTLIENGGEETAEAAQLFYYLNRTGFNGLCRFSKSGKFNVPVGRYKSISYRDSFADYQSIFSEWEFLSSDFEKLKLRSTDFIYADPPYDVEFTEYSAGGFSWEDQVRAAEWLAKHSGPVALSNQATERIINLYRSLDFSIELLDAPRRISCTGDRTKAKEVLATKNVA